MKKLILSLLATLIALTLGCGYSKKATTPAQPGTLPTIAMLAPNSVAHGDPAFVLVVTGTNFSTTAVINLNGVAQTTNQVSGTQLTATIPAADIEAAGTLPVTVTNPATVGSGAYGSGGSTAATSTPVNLTVN